MQKYSSSVLTNQYPGVTFTNARFSWVNAWGLAHMSSNRPAFGWIDVLIFEEINSYKIVYSEYRR